MKMVNKSVSNQILLVLLIITVTCFAIIIYLEYKNIGDIQYKITMAQDDLLKSQVRLQVLNKLKEDYPQFEQKLALYGRLIPDTPDEQDIIKDMDRLLNASGARLKHISFDGSEPSEGFVAMPMSITIDANYFSLLNFLDALDGYNRLIRIDSISMGRQSDTSELNVNMSCRAFYRQENSDKQGDN